jgi:RhoGEF domain/FYVE zinc finger
MESRADQGGMAAGVDEIPPNTAEAKRLHVIAEILSSERTYVQRLQLTLDLYLMPLRKQGILEPGELNTQFLNWELLLGLHKDLHDSMLREQDAGVLDVGARFTTFSHFLKCYSQYLANFDRAREERAKLLTSNRKFAAFVDKVQTSPESMMLPLESFLMEPVQRVPRYRLLLEQLLKYTPEDHPEFASLIEALQLTAEVAQANSDAILERENRDKIMTVMMQITPATRINLMDDPSRLLLKEATLHRQCRRGIKEFRFWLFTDRLLYGDKVSVMVGPNMYKLNRDVSLYECRAQSFLSAAGGLGSEDSTSGSEAQSMLDADTSIDSSKMSSNPRSSHNRVSSIDEEDEDDEAGEHAEEDDNLALAAKLLGLDVDSDSELPVNQSSPVSTKKTARRSSVVTSERSLPDTHAFIVQSPQKSFVAWAPSEAEKNVWIDSISSAVDALQKKASVEAGGRVAPLWIPDTSTSQCQHCNTKFGAAVWRHHCRSCGILTCDNCSKNRISLPQINSSSKERVCDRCFKSLSAAANVKVDLVDKVAQNCELCSKSFSLLLHKHRCKSCSKIFCHSCSSRKMLLPHVDAAKPRRVCDVCAERLCPST